VTKLQLTVIPNEPVQAAGFGKQNFGVLDIYVVVVAEPLFRHHGFVGLPEQDKPAVFLHPDLNITTVASDVHLAV
jgi:hypothetical protein